MSEWIKLDANEIRRTTPVPSPSGTMVASVSPYDIPEAVRVDDSDPSRLAVMFRYATEEPWDRRTRDRVQMWIGRNSGRLYKVEVDARNVQPNERLQISIQDVGIAIQWLADQPEQSRRTENYSIARNVLKTAPLGPQGQIKTGA